ncbi:hypothetical protein PoB_002143200 [Plakobranchus ocellatus]|uniref:Uncharacterized protein n=1 Tax=Plakobranchus ocellatus TaxID=259542 RepID=A0AAV3ZK57_9GAST|nr:hypothetical protein PoB_002143200 [Plakobranchus ocellatus]
MDRIKRNMLGLAQARWTGAGSMKLGSKTQFTQGDIHMKVAWYLIRCNNGKIKCNAAKEEWVNQQCQKIEQKLNIDSKFMHAKIKDVSGKKIKCSSPGYITSKDGTMIMDKKKILNRWSKYVEDLFEDDRGKKPKKEKNIESPIILKEEVRAAIKKMKNGKGTGPDIIPVEIIKALDNLGIDLTTKLNLLMLYASGTIQDDLCKSFNV